MRNILRIFAVMLAVLPLSQSLMAQHSDHDGHDHSGHTHSSHRHTDSHLTGHVVDASTGQHLPYITIVLEGTQLASLTDASGHFSLYNVPVGKYKMTASSVGYQTQTLDVEVVAHKTVEVKFSLDPSMLQIE